MLKVTYLINGKEYGSMVAWKDLKSFRLSYEVIKVEIIR